MRIRRLVTTIVLGLGLTVALLALGLAQRNQAHAAEPIPRCVSTEGNDSSDCDCRSEPPCQTIQYAVDRANEGDEIRVAAGRYEKVNDYGGLAQIVYVDKTVTIRGGYTEDWETRDPVKFPTTLDAGGKGRVLYITGSVNPTIEGLRVTGGDAAGLGGGPGAGDAGGGVYIATAAATLDANWIFQNSAETGGGVYLNSSAATLTGNAVSTNTASVWGGGLYLDHSPATLDSNTVYGNGTSGMGGGMFLMQSNAVISGNTIADNTASDNGGGLYLDSTATVNGNTISGNHADHYGGGLLLITSAAALDGNTVFSNTAGLSGGGMVLEYSRAALTNTVIVQNAAQGAGSGLYVLRCSPRLLHTTLADNSGGSGAGLYVTDWSGTYSTVVLSNTIVAGHATGISVTAGNTVTLNGVLWYSNTAANIGGGGTISVTRAFTGNPAFVNPAGGNYHVGAASAALNRGVEAGVARDIDGDLRDQAPDLGVDEVRTCWARLNSDSTDYPTVQAAVDASTRVTDVVKVAGYCAGINTAAGLRQSVYLSKTLTLRGGYTTTNWSTSNPAANPTTLDALGLGRVLYVTGAITPTIEGLRITGGDATWLGSGMWSGGVGGGVYVSGAAATLRDNHVFSNTAVWGGGLYLNQSGATLLQNRVTTNTAGYFGGGLLAEQSAMTLISNTIAGNSAPNSGGGANLSVSPASLTGNVFSDNHAGMWGGGLVVDRSNAPLIGNTFSANTAGEGGGLYLYQSSPVISGNTVISNVASQMGGGINLGYHSDAALTGNTICGNTAYGQGVYFAQGGGGLYLGQSAATLISNTICSNAAPCQPFYSYCGYGGGLLLNESAATLTGNDISANSAARWGGGLLLRGSPATLTQNVISANAAGDSGGGLRLLGSDNAMLVGNVVLSNTTLWYGGGLCINGGGILSGNLVLSNTAAHYGGGIALTWSYATLVNTVVADNRANEAGSGLYINASYPPRLVHTTIARNSGGDGSGIHIAPEGGPSTVALTNTILVSQTVGIAVTAGSTATLDGVLWYSNTTANVGGTGTVAVTHAITGAPAFAADGYHLTASSAAIDGGVSAGVATDLDGEARPIGPRPDLGADEFPAWLSVTQAATPNPVVAGARLTYTLRVTNTGVVDLHATITDTLPEQVTPTGTLLWSPVIPAPGGVWSQTVVVTVTWGYSGTLANLVEVTTEEGATGAVTVLVDAICYKIYLPLVLRNY
jgi:parallel beta-helix repeat protein